MNLRKLHPLLLAFIFLFSGSVSGSSLKTSPSAFEVVSSDFGLFNTTDTGKTTFRSSKVVPLVPGQTYGWIIKLRIDKPKIKWREELTLPSKPVTWGPAEPIGTRNTSTNGRTTITERTVAPEEGIILNGWAVAPGDPKGRYVIRVFVEGSLATTFEFDVK